MALGNNLPVQGIFTANEEFLTLRHLQAPYSDFMAS